MKKNDPRIDTYIAKSAVFARPILNHLRRLVHAACPEVEETMKWSFPHFEYKGVLCSMAAFKNHCTFGFWKSALIFGKNAPAETSGPNAMGQFGRLAAISDLPDEATLLGYIKEAVRLNEAGIRLPAKPKAREKKELVVPKYFMDALKANSKALAAFESFSYSHQKEYVEWITEAKGEETRKRRMETALMWMAEGKTRHWRHAKC